MCPNRWFLNFLVQGFQEEKIIFVICSINNYEVPRDDSMVLLVAVISDFRMGRASKPAIRVVGFPQVFIDSCLEVPVWLSNIGSVAASTSVLVNEFIHTGFWQFVFEPKEISHRTTRLKDHLQLNVWKILAHQIPEITAKGITMRTKKVCNEHNRLIICWDIISWTRGGGSGAMKNLLRVFFICRSTNSRG